MQRDRVIMLLVSVVAALVGLLSVAAPSQGEGFSNRGDNLAAGLQEGTFSLTQLPENPKHYSLVISAAEEQVISGSFTVPQLQVLKAIMTEAEKFALNAEAAGTKDPITTRFEDKQEKSFAVDVEKTGNQSKLFLTLRTEIGNMTVDAGRVIRSSRREEGFYFDLLSRLESVLPKLPAK